MKLDFNIYAALARDAVAQGQVLLKNDQNVLPLDRHAKVAVFGRMQNHYYKSGTGSGGMVNVPKVYGILDALKEESLELNQELLALYEEFDKENPYDLGVGFGTEPWSQKEMPLSMEVAQKAAKESEIAIVIIARTAGEEQDYVDAAGAYRLSEDEASMLKTVRAAFSKMIVVMNVSAVLDMQEIIAVSPEAILYAWQGGEIGGYGTADVLVGRVSPSGKLVDSIVKDITKAPAHKFFGNKEKNCYAEDIYVGYRYYETFDPDAVLYPFGFGLSYTSFDLRVVNCSFDHTTRIEVAVKNTGNVDGAEVVQVYVEAPQGQLGKPVRTLCGFAKTGILAPSEEELLTIEIPEYRYASYDEEGACVSASSYVLEKGAYTFFMGNSVRNLTAIGDRVLTEDLLIEQLSKQMAPIVSFDRMKPVLKDGKYEIAWESVKASPYVDVKEAAEDTPEVLPYAGDQGIKLSDVKNGTADMDRFLSQLSEEDLASIIRGEGMGSPKVTPGTAAAFGGVSPTLKALGIPCGCCSDGPSGMRLDSGTRAFSLPNGTLLACTWNPKLNYDLYAMLGIEMCKNKIDVLLGPGMNIHRHPLNGRNFEYFSEDPLMTGLMASAQIRGMQSAGVTGTLKHFCGNNQETNRHTIDSIVSERALREIYLKGFEIAVRNGADSIMTTYGSVNGAWTNSRHDLNTNILRGEWGFEGIVMTDWWANIGDFGPDKTKTNFARLVLAQNDFYAVCPDASVNSSGDNTLEALADGRITRGQLVRCAKNICGFLMHTNAMQRMMGKDVVVEVENFVNIDDAIDPSAIEYYEIKDGTVIDLSGVDCTRGLSFVFGVDAIERGCYFMDLTGSSELGELAQINVAIFMQSIPGGAFSFHGTKGEWMTVRRKILFSAKYGVIRLFFSNSGLKLRDVKFTFEKSVNGMTDWGEYADYIYG